MQTKLITAGVLVVGASALGGMFIFGGGDDTPIVEDAGALYADASAFTPNGSFEPMVVDEVERKVPESSEQGGFGFGRGDFAARMAQFDLDGDGILSDEERQAMKEEMLARFDLDGDGVLSREERMAARQARFENSDRGQALMRQFDLDGDGVLDADEQAAMDAYNQEQRDARRAEQIAEYDFDGDGELSQEERQAQRDDRQYEREQFMADLSDEFDADGDGELSIEEQQDAFNAMRERREVDRFVDQFDSNGDGSMTAADYEAFVVDYGNGEMSADVNNDGIINMMDLTAYRDLVARWTNRP